MLDILDINLDTNDNPSGWYLCCSATLLLYILVDGSCDRIR
ncbi:MAG: hypothetical protein ACTS2F_03125 [Thainema sp.]